MEDALAAPAGNRPCAGSSPPREAPLPRGEPARDGEAAAAPPLPGGSCPEPTGAGAAQAGQLEFDPAQPSSPAALLLPDCLNAFAAELTVAVEKALSELLKKCVETLAKEGPQCTAWLERSIAESAAESLVKERLPATLAGLEDFLSRVFLSAEHCFEVFSAGLGAGGGAAVESQSLLEQASALHMQSAERLAEAVESVAARREAEAGRSWAKELAQALEQQQQIEEALERVGQCVEELERRARQPPPPPWPRLSRTETWPRPARP